MRIAVRELALQVPASERLTRARECGADGIELCFGPYEFDNHPFLQLDGAAVLQQRSQALGIELTSAYAGHLHDASLADADVVRRQRQISALARLIDASGRAGVRVVVVPLFRSAPRVESDALAKLRSILVPLAEQAKAQGVTLAVEAAWPVNALQSFLGASCALHVAYDVGNAFRLGYDPLTDLSLLGDQVIQVRLRDNTVDGRRVPLGTGVVPLTAIVHGVLDRKYPGWFIVESPVHADAIALQSAIQLVRQLDT